MTWQCVNLADVAPSPWRNGGGTTRELVAWPNAQDWVWRMSVAEVTQGGPFSRFEGVQRWFTVLSGTGVELQLQVAQHPRAPLQTQHQVLTTDSGAFTFDGATPVECSLLDGPTQDFNLMLRKDKASGTMRKFMGTVCVELDAPKIVAVYAIDTGAMATFGTEVVNLQAGWLAWRALPAQAEVHLQAASALWMEIAV